MTLRWGTREGRKVVNTACERGESSWERKTRSTRGDRNRSYSSEKRQGKMKKAEECGEREGE